MRNAFADEMTKLAASDSRMILLSGDIGNRLFDRYKDSFPTRFLNCGVAEANMIGMASGMALSGLRPVVYTINAFATVRCLEQIRVDVCYHKAPVIIVGVGAGLSYASLGGTHHSLEDIAMLRALPGMTIVCPGDPIEVRLALRAAIKHDGPVFIRLGKKGEPNIHREIPPFVIGKGIVVRPGKEVCLLSTGHILPVALEAAEALERKGISAQVTSFHTVKPLDEALLTDIFSKFMVVATIEEHSILGGLGGSIAEWMVDQWTRGTRGIKGTQSAYFYRFGTADHFFHEAGDQTYAQAHFGLTAEHISKKIFELCATYSEKLMKL